MKVTVQYQLSRAARRAATIATGESQGDTQWIEVDLVPLTPEDRGAVLAVNDAMTHGSLRLATWQVSGLRDHSVAIDWQAEYDHVLIQEEVLAELRRMAAELPVVQSESKAARMQAATNALTHDTEVVRRAIAGHQVDISRYDLSCGAGNLPYQQSPAYDEERAAWAEWQALKPQFEAEAEARDQAAEKVKAAKAEAQRAEMVAWAAATGSERLQLALKHGYKCRRLYAEERAAVELGPDYHIPSDEIELKERLGPSLEALQEVEVLQAKGIEAEVMWEKPDEYNEGREAVVVEDFHDYTFVRAF